jgi:hypothetical protein
MLHIQQQKRLVAGMVLGASSARDMLNIKLLPLPLRLKIWEKRREIRK